MKKRIVKILCIFILLFTFTSNVLADKVTNVGDTVNDEGTYNATRFIAGNNVTSKSNVDGISFIAGNQVIFEGNNTYGFYAGNIVTINGTVEKDLFVAGNNISINNTAKIGRDIYAAGNTINIKTNIERDLRIGADSVNLSGIIINGDAYIAADQITMDSDTVIVGTLSYDEDAIITGLDLAKIGNINKIKIDNVTVKTNYTSNLYSFIVSTIAAFVTLVVLFYLLPKTNNLLDNLNLEIGTIAKTIGVGLAVLLVFPLIAIIALFTGFLTPVALIGLALYACSIYIAITITYYIIGINILKKVFNKDNKYLSIIIGIIIVKLIKLIPIIGDWVGALLLFYGLGLIFNYLKSGTNK